MDTKEKAHQQNTQQSDQPQSKSERQQSDQLKSAGAFRSVLQENVNTVTQIMGGSSDVIVRELEITEHCRVALLFLEGMIDTTSAQNSVISPLLKLSGAKEISLKFLADRVIETGEVSVARSFDEAIEQIVFGSLILMIDGEPGALVISIADWEDRAVMESKAQPAVRGPQNSFTEKLRTNTTLVRRKVKDTRVRLVSLQIGNFTKTEVALMYMEGLADDKLVQQLHQNLKSINKDQILEGEYIEEIILSKKQFTIFPRFYNSDRPDTIAAGILEGRIAIFIDGTPFVLIAPTLFVDFLQSAEDYYQPFLYSSLIRILRYISLFICLFSPSLYIALTTFHQDTIPTQLLISIAGQREGTPFPAFIEALIMEVAFEILREAGIRMPRTIGQAVSIVGTIVIGQAAVEAGIVSAAMVIVVAITAISSFVIPAYNLAIPIRIIRFLFMILAATFGSYGITIGWMLLLIHLCHLNSFGVPYMSPIAPTRRRAARDAVLRYPYRSRDQQ
ncbi:Spore germination protein B1 [compost metagenome]